MRLRGITHAHPWFARRLDLVCLHRGRESGGAGVTRPSALYAPAFARENTRLAALAFPVASRDAQYCDHT